MKLTADCFLENMLNNLNEYDAILSINTNEHLIRLIIKVQAMQLSQAKN